MILFFLCEALTLVFSISYLVLFSFKNLRLKGLVYIILCNFTQKTLWFSTKAKIVGVFLWKLLCFVYSHQFISTCFPDILQRFILSQERDWMREQCSFTLTKRCLPFCRLVLCISQSKGQLFTWEQCYLCIYLGRV